MRDSYFPMLQEDLDNLCEYEHGDLQRIVKSFHAEIERLTAEKAPCENCGRMTEAAGEEIICDRCAAFEEAAKLHEQVTLEGRHEDAMAAVIEYRDLIRAAAKRHAPLQYPDDRSALIEKACSAPDGCISAGQGGAG